jgi:hypothetical protein
VAVRSKACVCSRSFAGTADSNPAGVMSNLRESFVLSGRGFCEGLVIRPHATMKCGVSECDREVSVMRRPWPARNCRPMEEKNPETKLRKASLQVSCWAQSDTKLQEKDGETRVNYEWRAFCRKHGRDRCT